MPINWGVAKSLAAGAGRAAWNSRPGKGAVGGAAVGGLYGMFADDSSLIGGAFRGAATGAMFGATKGWGLGATVGGAAFNTVMGGSPMWGALGGYGAYRGVRAGRSLGGSMLGAYRGSRLGGSGVMASMGNAGRWGFSRTMAQGRASARHIGQTAQRVVNPIRGIFV